MASVSESVLAALRDIVGAAGVVESDDASPLLNDHLGRYAGRAALVLRPANTEQVAAILALCYREKIGVVPQGGNTGYCGGATPDESGAQVLLSLARMRQIREVDPINYTMTVEAGVVLASVQAAAETEGLLFPLSLGSEGSCQIGGNLATNAGGTAVLQYGNAGELVLGVEAVLPDGRVFSQLSKLRKDNAGYDLKQLFLGSEGTLGVITAAVLRLFPQPAVRQTAFVAVRDVRAACELLARARRRCGDTVVSFEYIPRFALGLTLQHIERAVNPLDGEHEHHVLLELASADPAADLAASLEGLLGDALTDGLALDAAVAQSEQQRDAMWHIREHVPAAQKAEGGSLKHDVSVPVSALPTLLADGVARVREICPGVRPCTYGHIGDGNLHFNFHPPAGEALASFIEAHGARINDAVYTVTTELGGSVCAEHGVGRYKRPLLAAYTDPVRLALMRQVKAALDPHGIMNPGKVV